MNRLNVLMKHGKSINIGVSRRLLMEREGASAPKLDLREIDENRVAQEYARRAGIQPCHSF
jgi:hypothetical protein